MLTGGSVYGQQDIFLAGADQNGTIGSNTQYLFLKPNIQEHVVYTGQISAIDDDNSTITFYTEQNVTGDYIDPFVPGVFQPGMQVPEIDITFNSAVGSVSDISYVYYAGYSLSGRYGGNSVPKSGFTHVPKIYFDESPTGDTATATCTIDEFGEITSMSMLNPGSGYDAAPDVWIEAGMHLATNLDGETSIERIPMYIMYNTSTKLQLRTTYTRYTYRSESVKLTDIFSVGCRVQITRATTLGNLLGTDIDELPVGWGYGLPDVCDWVYLWDVNWGGYSPYFFNGDQYESAGWSRGWYHKYSTSAGVLNYQVIYPDEGIIFAKRTDTNCTFTINSEVNADSTVAIVPENGNQSILSLNRTNADYLCELIPANIIGNDVDKWKTGSSFSDENKDTLTTLTGSVWKSFWYQEGVNSAVTKPHVIVTRTPRESGGVVDVLDEDDLCVNQLGDITNITSSDIDGDDSNISGNQSGYTKIYITGGTTTDLIGFDVNITSLEGYLLLEGGYYEANATSGNLAISPQRGSLVDSCLNGEHEIINAGTNWILLAMIRDVNFYDNGVAKWSVGSLGSGYNQDALIRVVGGSTVAQGTVSPAGVITLSVDGEGVSNKPRCVVSGGGWRLSDAAPRDFDTLNGAAALLQRSNLGTTDPFGTRPKLIFTTDH